MSTDGDGRAALANIRVFNDGGELLAEFNNLELRRTMSMGSQAGLTGKGNDKAASTQVFKSRSQLMEMLQPLSKKERIGQLSKWLSTEIKDTLGQAAEGLNIDKLPPSAAFLEIGLDSLLVTELQRRIQEKAVDPAVVAESLRKLPAFRQAYEVDGLAVEEFAGFGPVQHFANIFRKGWDTLVAACGTAR